MQQLSACNLHSSFAAVPPVSVQCSSSSSSRCPSDSYVQVGRQPHLLFKAFAEQYGPLFKVSLPGKGHLVISSSAALLPKILGLPSLPKTAQYATFNMVRLTCLW